MKRQIPYAVMDYEKLVRENYYFVDKTEYLRPLEAYQTPVFLRPRRFGKSMWCSIQECYYDLNRKDCFDELFGKTAIGKNPTPLHNTMMVMRFDFSIVSAEGGYTDIEKNFTSIAMMYVRSFVSNYKNIFDFSSVMQAPSAASALASILKIVRDKKLPPVCVIIDEYDNFTNQLVTGSRDRLYYDVTTGDSFLRTFFKAIKTGIDEGGTGRVFITGVLPITIDDLTSGFNIGEVVSLKPLLLSMMGFTQAEVERYVEEIFANYGWDAGRKERVLGDLQNLYDGYRFLPGAKEPLYNSTVCNFYLKDFVVNGGTIPAETVDPNLRTDVNWLRRLAGSDEAAREALERLMTGGTLPANTLTLSSKFNMNRFFSRDYFGVDLYYLGMLSFAGPFSLGFPNLTVKTIFADYYDELERFRLFDTYQPLGDAALRFFRDHDLGAFFAVYWKVYVGQFPAQTFDKANENLFRITFYNVCLQYFYNHFTLAAEANLRAGRCDFQAVGRLGSGQEDYGTVLEFKYYPAAEAKKLGVMDWAEPPADALAQARAYAAELAGRYPELKTVAPHVVCIASTLGFRFW